jgi:asparagine synthase (glutamine-hydrolysing)
MNLPHKLNGMFSIAIWDRKKRQLILIRDRFGVKPLFYSFTAQRLIFASEIKSLLSLRDLDRSIDYEALSHYLSLRNVPAPFTIYKSIRSLLPGHMIIWNRDQFKISRWYQLTMSSQYTPEDEVSLIDKLDALIHDSVKLRLRADVKYGAYLSGGIDSSLIVAVMSKYSQRPVETFSLVYADHPVQKQDALFARSISKLYSTEHRECVMSWEDLERDLPSVTCQLDQPFAGVIASYWLSRYMSGFVTVALSGDGADDLFASYGHHRLVWPISKIRACAKTHASLQEEDFGFFKERKEFVKGLAGYEPWEWRLAYASFMDHEKESLLSERGLTLMRYSTASFLRNIYQQCAGEADALNKMLYLDINTLLPNEILYFNDMLSMANSLEVRTPFLDYRIAELASSIPGELKIRGLTLKYILRQVAARYLPREIIERPKEGFVLPKHIWLKGGLLPLLRNLLSPERLGVHGFFNYQVVDNLVERFLKGDDSLTFRIWTLMVFQVWYENYLKDNA